MKFLHHLFSSNKPTGFDSISGYEDIKQLICRALHSDDSINILFWGEPASSKTMFLMELAKEKGAVYFDCTNTTSRILDILEQERPKTILLDEVEKMNRVFQTQLLNFLESGHIKVDQMKSTYDFTIKGAKVFASANDLNKLSAPLRSRFRRLHLPKYTEEQFLEIAVKVCPKLPQEKALLIGQEVWNQKGDIRDIISISKLVQKRDGPGEIAEIINTMRKYGGG
jgi:replication-associated recombination protein RarA